MKTGRPKKLIRNAAIVVLHKINPNVFTFGKIAEILGMARQTVHEIWMRDNDKYDIKVVHSPALDKCQGKS
jgi:hypothetical protein